jgi:hypothetical protein
VRWSTLHESFSVGASGSRTAVIRVSAAIELVIGIVLLAIPARVIEALIGPPSSGTTSVVARVLGGALLALGAAGTVARVAPNAGVTIAYFVYNVATVAVLASAGISGTASGGLLWPVVAVHLLLALAVVMARQ